MKWWWLYIVGIIGLLLTDIFVSDHVWAATVGFWCGIIAVYPIYMMWFDDQKH